MALSCSKVLSFSLSLVVGGGDDVLKKLFFFSYSFWVFLKVLVEAGTRGCVLLNLQSTSRSRFQLLGASAPCPPTGTPSSTTLSSSVPVPPAYQRRYGSSKCAAKETPICPSVSSPLPLVSLHHATAPPCHLATAPPPLVGHYVRWLGVCFPFWCFLGLWR